MGKIFVLLTEATLSSEKATRSFGEDNTIVVPMAIVEKLYNYNEIPEKAKIASKFIDYLGTFEMKDLLSKEGVKQDNGSRLKIVDCQEISAEISRIRGLTELYKRCFQVCVNLAKTNSQVILISQNPSVRMKAELLGISSQPFKDEIFPAPEDQYTGRVAAYTLKSVIDSFYKNGSISIEDIYQYDSFDWKENMFVTLSCETNSSAIGRYSNGKIQKLMYQDPSVYKPHNVEQKMLMECLLAPPEIAPLVIVKGGAGTGKTFCALSAALNKLNRYNNKNTVYDQILVGSPTVTIDEDLGYLPGDIDNKVGPYLGGIRDNLKSIFQAALPDNSFREIDTQVQYLFEDHFIDIQPIGFLRGRSIPNRFFLLDEVQNIKPEILLDIITRAAVGTKIVLAGDPTQVNTPGLNTRRNGLVYISEKMKGNPLCWQVTLDSKKTIRSELAKVAQEIL